MNNRNYFLATLLSVSVLAGMPAFAQDKDVDQADSLDFESFHKDKKAAVKAWKDTGVDATKNAPIKTYDQTPTTAPAATSTSPAVDSTPAPLVAEKASAATGATVAKPTDAAAKTGQRYEIRERYTLARSTKTPYSAFYVIEPLYKQSVQLCPRGWKKLTERSEPIEQDYYLYYEIECL